MYGYIESESEVAQSCPTLCDPVDCSPPGSSVHGILQARILEWVAICCFKATHFVILCDSSPRKQYKSYVRVSDVNLKQHKSNVRKSQMSIEGAAISQIWAILSIHNNNRSSRVKQTFKHV